MTLADTVTREDMIQVAVRLVGEIDGVVAVTSKLARQQTPSGTQARHVG